MILPGMIAIALDLRRGRLPCRAKAQQLRFRHGHADHAGPLFPGGIAGAGPDRADGIVHERHGGQCHRLQHRLYLRHLSELHRARKSDEHYLLVGRITTVVGIVISIGAAYLPTYFNDIMDLLQLVFSFVNAPLFATFMLGMFWRRTTGHGAFWGLLAGTVAAAVHHGLTVPGRRVIRASTVRGLPWCIPTRSIWPRTFWGAIWAFMACLVVTVVISIATPRIKTDEELTGLVYSLTPKIKETACRGTSSPQCWA